MTKPIIDEERKSLRIENKEQAIRFLEEKLAEMQKWRNICDVLIPDRTDAGVKKQQQSFFIFLTKQGQLNGALQALYGTRMIDEGVYAGMTQKAINALLPSVVGQVSIK